MKQKIALIQPNSPFLINQRVFPNIGLTRVATQLRDEGHDVELLDYSGALKMEVIDDVTSKAHNYDLYGISSTTPQFPYAMNIHRALTDKNPNARTVIGGAHPSALYQAKQRGVDDINIKDMEVFDTVFCGEGEETSGIFKDGWQQGQPIENIDDCPIPDRDFINMDSYEYELSGEPTTTIQTQRGCPYKCTFCCGRDIDMYNKVRTHSPERVLEEMDELNEKYGFSSFMFFDDEINLNMNRLEELCDALSTRPYQHRGFVRSDGIVRHPESVDWLKKAGFVKLCTGVESGSNRMLQAIDKRTTSEANAVARQIIGDRDIHYEAFMLMGHPDETLDDVMMSRQWLLDNKPDDFDLNIVTPYPGSKMYDEAVPSSRDEQEWEYNGAFFNKPRYSTSDSYYKGQNAQSESNVSTNELSNKQLRLFRDSIDGEVRENLYGG